MQSDTKIFREVNALSRLSHRNIVRYYTTWVETFEPNSTVHSEDSSTDEGTTEGITNGMTSVPEHGHDHEHDDDNASERHLPINGGFHLNVEDFDDLSMSLSRSSFPSIHFGRSSSSTGEEEEEEADSNSNSTSSGEDGGDDFASLFASSHGKAKKAKSAQSQQSMVVIPSPSGKKKGKFVVPTSPAVSRTLYIQMVCSFSCSFFQL